MRFVGNHPTLKEAVMAMSFGLNSYYGGEQLLQGNGSIIYKHVLDKAT